MLNTEIVPWLLADSQVATPVGNRIYLQQIPQEITARPCIVVGGLDSYDDGTTGRVILENKLAEFRIHVEGTTASSLLTATARLIAKLQSPIATRSQITIGNYRVQCLQIRNMESGDSITERVTSDRKFPGGPEQAFAYVCLYIFASFHSIS